MTLTQNGMSTSLEFELPAYATDKIVTSVDTTNNTITVTTSGKTGEAPETGGLINLDGEEFKVAGKYDGNLGTLIGRTVNFQYDTDENLTAFSLDEAEVVYGAMQYVNDTGDFKDGYYKDKITGTKYKNSATATSTKNVTQVFDAKTGALIDFNAATPAVIDNEPDPNDTFQYAKLVLNPDGTVSTANVVATLPINLFLTEIDGTKAIQDKNNGVDLDGYTIVKDDEYVKPADLQPGDVVFVNSTVKFADVYNNEVSGEISNVISGKLDIDEKTYNWNGAQYYDEGDDVYKKLKTGDDDEASQNYLNSLDTEVDTTIWLNRKGDIVYLDGTETGVVTTTDVTYLVIEDAKGYTESLKNIIQLKTFNGDETETLAIKVDGLKYFNGVAGEYSKGTHAGAWNGDADDDLTFKGTTDGSKDFTNSKIAALFPAGRLAVVTYDASGKAVGLKSKPDVALTNNASFTNVAESKFNTTKSPNLSKDTSLVTVATPAAANQKYSMGSYTDLWIWNYGKDGAPAGGDDSFKKVVLTDFENEIKTTDWDGDPIVGTNIRVNGTKATDIMMILKSDAAYKTADINAINGMLTKVTYKNNSDNTKQVINTITILGTDGESVTYTGNGTVDGVNGAKPGDYITLTQDKVSEKITAVANTANWEYGSDGTSTLLADRGYDAEKLVLANGKALTVAEGGAILLRYTEEGTTKHKIVTYSDVNTIESTMNVWYNDTYLSEDGTAVQSDMIVVGAATDAQVIALANTAIAAAKTATKGAGNYNSVALYNALATSVAKANMYVADAAQREDIDIDNDPGADIDTTDLTTAVAELTDLNNALKAYKSVTAGYLTANAGNSNDAKGQILTILQAVDGASATDAAAKLVVSVKAAADIVEHATSGTFTVEFIDGTSTIFTLSQKSGDAFEFNAAIAKGA